jgi:hypothetical protein
MAKTGKKRTAKPRKTGVTKRAAKKTVAKTAAPSKADHHAVFKSLAKRSNQYEKAPVCYQQLSDDSWLICFLQSDGSYGQCQPYGGPIHQPPCG